MSRFPPALTEQFQIMSIACEKIIRIGKLHPKSSQYGRIRSIESLLTDAIREEIRKRHIDIGSFEGL
jgi:hypothetical protein